MCPSPFLLLTGSSIRIGVVAGGEPLSFLLCVVAAGVSCCRVVGLVVVVVLCLGFVLVLLGLVLCPVSLWLFLVRC